MVAPSFSTVRYFSHYLYAEIETTCRRKPSLICGSQNAKPEQGTEANHSLRHSRTFSTCRRDQSQNVSIADLRERQSEDTKLGRYPTSASRMPVKKLETLQMTLVSLKRSPILTASVKLRLHGSNGTLTKVGCDPRREIERALNKYVYPSIGDRKFLDVRRGEINALLDHVSDNHGRSQADAVLARIRSICNFYAARNEHYVSPIVRGMKRSKQSDRKQLRFLNDDEIRLVWDACDQLGYVRQIVKVALLLGQRKGKLGGNDAAMKWSDIKDGVWTIDVEEREKGTAAKIKLPKMVREIIEQQPRLIAGILMCFRQVRVQDRSTTFQ